MKMWQRRAAWIFTACVVALAIIAFKSPGVTVDDAKAEKAVKDNMTYELRIYTANEGKFEALHDRFRNHTMRLFEKHGIKNIAYWIDVDTPNTLVYIVAHKSKDDAKKSWDAFKADPEWTKAYAASIANGKLVKKVDNTWLKPADYSPFKVK